MSSAISSYLNEQMQPSPMCQANNKVKVQMSSHFLSFAVNTNRSGLYKS